MGIFPNPGPLFLARPRARLVDGSPRKPREREPQKGRRVTLSQILKPRLGNFQSNMPPRNTFPEHLILAQGWDSESSQQFHFRNSACPTPKGCRGWTETLHLSRRFSPFDEEPCPDHGFGKGNKGHGSLWQHQMSNEYAQKY